MANYNKWVKGLSIHKCPKCGCQIEKDKGCPDMICSVCNYKWCWSCGCNIEKQEKSWHMFIKYYCILYNELVCHDYGSMINLLCILLFITLIPLTLFLLLFFLFTCEYRNVKNNLCPRRNNYDCCTALMYKLPILLKIPVYLTWFIFLLCWVIIRTVLLVSISYAVAIVPVYLLLFIFLMLATCKMIQIWI